MGMRVGAGVCTGVGAGTAAGVGTSAGERVRAATGAGNGVRAGTDVGVGMGVGVGMKVGAGVGVGMRMGAEGRRVGVAARSGGQESRESVPLTNEVGGSAIRLSLRKVLATVTGVDYAGTVNKKNGGLPNVGHLPASQELIRTEFQNQMCDDWHEEPSPTCLHG